MVTRAFADKHADTVITNIYYVSSMDQYICKEKIKHSFPEEYVMYQLTPEKYMWTQMNKPPSNRYWNSPEWIEAIFIFPQYYYCVDSIHNYMAGYPGRVHVMFPKQYKKARKRDKELYPNR